LYRNSSPAGFAIRTEAFLQELRHLGYVEGRNVVIEWRWAENQPEQIPRLAAELAGLGVDVIVTGGTAPARALKNATRTIPIVMALVEDPVGTGLVDSLARPGANLTGFSDFAPALTAKRLEILKEIAPQASRVVVMLNQTNPNIKLELEAARAAARALGIELIPLEISEPSTLEAAFAKVVQHRAGAFTVLTARRRAPAAGDVPATGICRSGRADQLRPEFERDFPPVCNLHRQDT
jgi:putative ABC transport system substrate-binding protein